MMLLPFVPDGAQGATSSLSSGRAETQGGFAPHPGAQRALALRHPKASENSPVLAARAWMAINCEVIGEKFYLQAGPQPGGRPAPNTRRALGWEMCPRPEEHRRCTYPTPSSPSEEMPNSSLGS